MTEDTYERSALLLKSVIAENIDNFVSKHGTTSAYRLIGHGSYFQSKYLNDPMVRIIWDYICDFDFYVIHSVNGVSEKKATLRENCGKIVSVFYGWLQPLIMPLFPDGHNCTQTLIEHPDFITVKFNVNNLHLTDFTLMFEDKFVEHKHPLDEISSTQNTSPDAWCRVKNAHRNTILKYARQQGLVSDVPQMPLKHPIYTERNWIAKIVAWIIEKEGNKQKELSKEIAKLKSVHRQDEEKRKDQSKQLDTLKILNQQSDEKQKELSKEIDSLKILNQQSDEKQKELSKEIDTLKAVNQQSEEKQKEQLKEISDLKVLLQQSEEKQTELIAENTKLSQDLKTEKRDWRKMKTDIEKLQQQVNTLTEELKTSQQKNDSSKNQIVTLKAKVKDGKELTDQIERHKKEFKRLSEEKSKSQKEREEIDAQREKEKKELEKTKGKVKAAKERNDDLEKTVKQLNCDLDVLKQATEEVKRLEKKMQKMEIDHKKINVDMIENNEIMYNKLDITRYNAKLCAANLEKFYLEIHSTYENNSLKKLSEIVMDEEIYSKTFKDDILEIVLEVMQTIKAKFDDASKETKFDEQVMTLKACIVWDEKLIATKIDKIIKSVFDECMTVILTECRDISKQARECYLKTVDTEMTALGKMEATLDSAVMMNLGQWRLSKKTS
jgi:hypothetical protein